MVRITHVLSRVPVIKFRKGGVGHSGGAPAAAAPAAAAPASAPAAAQAQPAASMSTGAIPDIDLPLRYRRQPLSDEEIDHINGGGIV
ncbi:translation initiation factor IF-2 [Manduca sexta]|uniref:translation initiation factor IF-2 n=1 Tax=Manduca sexta TaxID=7130 RepID=UPI00188EE2F5|nr:translation initiation factor IF-2 [Manduca sexta]